MADRPNATRAFSFYHYLRCAFQQLLVIASMMMMGSCATVIGQKWSENYARQPGTQSTTPAVIDGDLNTAAPILLKIHPQKTYGYPPAETEISLPESKVIRRIVVHKYLDKIKSILFSAIVRSSISDLSGLSRLAVG